MSVQLHLTKQQNFGTDISAYTYDIDFASNLSSASNFTTTTTAGGTEIQATDSAGGNAIQWITPKIIEQVTITTMNVYFRSYESGTGVNASIRARLYKVGTDNSITELGGSPFDFGTELGTSAAGKLITCNITDTTFNIGERILVRAYFYNIGTMGSGSAYVQIHNSVSFYNYLLINEDVKFADLRSSFDYLQNSSTKNLGHFNGSITDSAFGNPKSIQIGSQALFNRNINKMNGISLISLNNSNKYTYFTNSLSGSGSFTIRLKMLYNTTVASSYGELSLGYFSTTTFAGIKIINYDTSLSIRFNNSFSPNLEISGLSSGVHDLLITEDSANRNLYAYVNGKLVGSLLSHDAFNINSTEVAIGRDCDTYIDELIIENVYWSPEKVRKYYTYIKGRYAII